MLIKLKLMSSALTVGIAALGLLPSGSTTPDAATEQAAEEQASAKVELEALMQAHGLALCEHDCSVGRVLAQAPR